ncbi:MAG: hypothetical protein JW828_05790 [Sedimentisphaerales bacterium]|nr:hypothetical protein [Sedimentisphaerales bacterium]
MVKPGQVSRGQWLRRAAAAGLAGACGAFLGFAAADRGVLWFPTMAEGLLLAVLFSLILWIGGQIMDESAWEHGGRRIRIRKRILLAFVVAFVLGAAHLTSCRMAQKSPLTELGPIRFNEAYETDLSQFWEYDRGLEAQLAILQENKSMFAGEDPQPLTAAQETLLRDVWTTIYDYAFALDRIRLFYEDWYRFDPSRAQRAYHVQSFLLTFAAELCLYEKATRLSGLVIRNPNAVKFLDAPHPGTNLGENTFSTFRQELHGTRDAVRIGGGRAYLYFLQKGMDAKSETAGLSCAVLWDKIETELAILDAIAPGERTALTVGSDMEAFKQGVDRVWYPSVKGVATWMGDTRVHRRIGQILVTRQQQEVMDRALEPGDILMTRKNWYMSNVGLPGFWPHAVLYVGSPAKLAEYFNDPDVSAYLAGLVGKKVTWSEYMAQTYPRLWLEYSLEVGDEPHRVIESVKNGVCMHTLSQCAGDYIAALRPRRNKVAKAQAIIEAFRHVGKPYDYQFDFATDHALVCTELVWRSWRAAEGKDGLDLPLMEIAGTKTLPTNEIARLYAESFDREDRPMDFVYFLDAREKEGIAVVATEEDYRQSWKRVKWSFWQE